MESFDPFHEWLGRPAGRWPADYYELLHLTRFEPDLDLISHTLETLRVRIRKIRPGAHLAEWQRVLDQLEAAKQCLSDPISKAAYDESIETAPAMDNVPEGPIVTPDFSGEPPDLTEAAASPSARNGYARQPAEASPPVEAPPVVVEPLAGRQSEGAADFVPRRSLRRRSGKEWPIRVLLFVVVLLVVAVGLALLKQQRDAERARQLLEEAAQGRAQVNESLEELERWHAPFGLLPTDPLGVYEQPPALAKELGGATMGLLRGCRAKS